MNKSNRRISAAVIACACMLSFGIGALAEDTTAMPVTEIIPEETAVTSVTEPVPEETEVTTVTELAPEETEVTTVTELPEETEELAEEEAETFAAYTEVIVDEEIVVPTIKVTLPVSADVVINPYRLKTEVGGSESYDSIASPPYTIKNESDCRVKITATASAQAQGNAVIASAPLKGGETTNSLFLFIETAYGDKNFTGVYDANAENQLAIGTDSVSKAVMTLEEGDFIPQEGKFRISGDAASAPDLPWRASDTVTINLSFKIDPVAFGE